MIQAPDYFWRKVAGYPSGQRLPKRGTWHDEYKPAPQASLSYDGKIYGPPLSNFGRGSSMMNGDPLGGGDYRLWCGADPTNSKISASFASCRCCGEVVVFRKERKDHMSGTGRCGKILETALKRVKRSHDCMICTRDTKNKRFGVPLCDRDCEHEWMYVNTTPQPLRYLVEEEREIWDKKVKAHEERTKGHGKSS